MSKHLSFTIKTASSAEELNHVRMLFKAYAASLPVDLSYQNFGNELSTLPGSYESPTGCLLLAVSTSSEDAIGCVALRPLPDSFTLTACSVAPLPSRSGSDSLVSAPKVAEMKRLYCIPESRGSGVGRALVEELLREAERLMYEEVRLDTLPSMRGAKKLYESLGFREVQRYYDTPIDGTVFLGKRLGAGAGKERGQKGIEREGDATMTTRKGSEC